MDVYKRGDNGSYLKASLQFAHNGNIVVGFKPFCVTRMRNAELKDLNPIVTLHIKLCSVCRVPQHGGFTTYRVCIRRGIPW